MKITRVGLDLAKRVFQVHGVDELGRATLRKQLSRAEVLEFFAQLPQCIVGMEACGGAQESTPAELSISPNEDTLPP